MNAKLYIHKASKKRRDGKKKIPKIRLNFKNQCGKHVYVYKKRRLWSQHDGGKIRVRFFMYLSTYIVHAFMGNDVSRLRFVRSALSQIRKKIFAYRYKTEWEKIAKTQKNMQWFLGMAFYGKIFPGELTFFRLSNWIRVKQTFFCLILKYKFNDESLKYPKEKNWICTN